MAIKSKNNKWYSSKVKVMAVILFFLSVLTIYLTSIVFLKINKEWDFNIIDAPTYYDTKFFKNQFFTLLDDVVEVNIHYQSENVIEKGGSVTNENLLSSFKNYYNIRDGIITQSTEINNSYDGLIVNERIPEDLEENFLEYKHLVEERLPQYRKIYIQNQLADFRTRQRRLQETNNFSFYLEDQEGFKVAGNASADAISNMKRTVVMEGRFCSNNLGVYFDYSNEILDESGYKLYAAIKDPIEPGDEFFQENEEFRLVKETLPILLCVGGLAGIFILVTFLYLVKVAGQKIKGGAVTFLAVDRIHNDVHLLLVTAFAFISISSAVLITSGLYYRNLDFETYIFSFLLGGLFMVDSVVFLNFCLSISRQIKGHQLIRNTLCAAIIRKISSLFSGKIFRGWIVFILLGYGIVNCILAVLVFLADNYSSDSVVRLWFLLLVLFNVVSAYLCIRALNSLTKIMVSAKETSKGNLGYALDITNISPSFINFATDVSNIQNGLKKAVEEAVKGERMKAELITNVSHDLKTPLTSIITYVDLLKKEDLENDTASHFVEVLYDKSYRLKQLIEDLIEASKASSGNLTVSKRKIDLRLLIMQAVGEMEEKIEKAGLQIKLSCEKDTFIYADGRHMWRIAENLISNVIKYSMPHSRVYIDIVQTQNWGLLIVKNISQSPIEVNPAHLTERFTRGDESRTTEGSGLGLSIAKSLSEIQDGSFSISVDGDLFKAIVKMPLWTYEEEQTTL